MSDLAATSLDGVRVLKWDVPLDDQTHSIGTGPVVLVAAQHSVDVVQVWTVEHGEPSPSRPVRGFGTGQPVPPGYRTHVGSAIAGPFVWHIFGAY